MTARDDDSSVTVVELRRAFDEGFARPLSDRKDRVESLLVLGLGEHRVALRATEAGGILRCPEITPLPGARPALLGIARLRSDLVAAYSLGALLGTGEPRAGRWCLLAGRHRTLCLVFDRLEAFVHVDVEAIQRNRESLGRARVAVADQLLELVDLRRILNDLEPSSDAPGSDTSGSQTADTENEERV